MRLVWNWRQVLQYAWSVRLIALATLLTGAEFVLQVFMDDPPLPRGTFAALGFLTTIAAGAARFIAQQNVSGGGK